MTTEINHNAAINLRTWNCMDLAELREALDQYGEYIRAGMGQFKETGVLPEGFDTDAIGEVPCPEKFTARVNALGPEWLVWGCDVRGVCLCGPQQDQRVALERLERAAKRKAAGGVN